jgi:hypothetical protein
MWLRLSITALAVVVTGVFLGWVFIQLFMVYDVPVSKLVPAAVPAPEKPIVRTVKTIAIGPDPLAEPDPLAVHRRVE